MSKELASGIVQRSFEDGSRLMFSTTLYSDEDSVLVDCGFVIGTIGKYTAIIQQSMESAKGPILISTDLISRVHLHTGVEWQCLGIKENATKKAATS